MSMSPLPDTIRDGTLLMIHEAETIGKPHLIIALNETEEALDTICEWIGENTTVHSIGVSKY